MKRILLLLITCILISGAGYTGTLPELNDVLKENLITPTEQPTKEPTQIKKDKNFPFVNTSTKSKQAMPAVLSPPESPYRKDTLLPLAPSVVPDYSSVTIVKKGKYTEYLNDTKDLIPLLENLKKVIQNKDENTLQFYSAKVSLINVYLNYLNKKYINKPERNFESYKELLKLNDFITETKKYWVYTAKYDKILRGSVKNNNKTRAIIDRRLKYTESLINKILDILKSNQVN